MQIIVIDTITGKTESLKCKKFCSKEIRQVAASTITSSKKYAISVVAESSKDIDFICSNFCNIPAPSDPTANKAIWAGDMATFIALNFPDM